MDLEVLELSRVPESGHGAPIIVPGTPLVGTKAKSTADPSARPLCGLTQDDNALFTEEGSF